MQQIENFFSPQTLLIDNRLKKGLYYAIIVSEFAKYSAKIIIGN